ncbi:MAG: hypothetical protein Q9180_009384 [Flavoplaca navasiana]
MADYQRVSRGHARAPDTASTNPIVEYHEEDESPPATVGFYHVPSTSGDSDSSTSSEYLDVLTPERSADGDVTDGKGYPGRRDAGMSDTGMSSTRADGTPFITGSHLVTIDPPTNNETSNPPEVPRPDAPMNMVRYYLETFIMHHRTECSSQQASSYAANFISDFNLQTSTDL